MSSSGTTPKPGFRKGLIKVYTDGASRGNPGPAGAGVFVSSCGKTESLAIFLSNKTNNEAEYLAVLIALKYLAKLFINSDQNKELSAPKIEVNLDSQLVVKQLNGEWKIKDERMGGYASQIKAISETIPYPIKFKHIGREKNQMADWLANQAIDLSQS